MRANYHTHSYRCNHATGENEEYIKEAITAGLDEIGLGDHMSHPGKEVDNFNRMPYENLEEYFKDIEKLQEKYKNEIAIVKGMECEYFSDFDWLYNELKEKHGAKYLILGVHFVEHEGKWPYVGSIKFDKGILKKYVDYVVESMESGYFTYIAHPDLFGMSYENWDDYAIEQSRRIFETAERLDMPLEINVNGMRKGTIKYNNGERYLYPIKEFWELSKEYNVKRIVGIDAHNPEELQDLDMGINFAKELGLEIIDKLDF